MWSSSSAATLCLSFASAQYSYVFGFFGWYGYSLKLLSNKPIVSYCYPTADSSSIWVNKKMPLALQHGSCTLASNSGRLNRATSDPSSHPSSSSPPQSSLKLCVSSFTSSSIYFWLSSFVITSWLTTFVAPYSNFLTVFLDLRPSWNSFLLVRPVFRYWLRMLRTEL